MNNFTQATSRTTGSATFGACNGQNERLFRINAGMCAEQALEHASQLMASAKNLTLLSALRSDDDGSIAWAAYYLGDMAKAIVDDVITGMQLRLVTNEPGTSSAMR